MPAPRKPGAPLRVSQQLASHAQPKPVNNKVGIGYYYQSAENLLRQARTYQRLHDDVQVYVFLMRFASLVMETLPQHQDFRPTDNNYKRLKKRLAADLMAELEQTKLRLNLPTAQLPVHNRYAKKQRPAEAVQTSLTPLPALDWGQYSQQPSATPQPEDGAKSNGDKMSAPLVSGSAQQNLLPFDLRQLGRLSSSSLPAASAETLQRHAVLPSADQHRRPSAVQLAQRPQPLYPSFDSVPLEPITYGFESHVPSAPPAPGASRSQGGVPSLMDAEVMCAPQLPPPPPLPPPQHLKDDLRQQQDANVKPRLELQLGPQELPVDMVSPESGICDHSGGSPSVSPLDKPAGFLGLRDVHVSVSLMEDFMRLCQYNTKRNIETIGLLGGSLSKDGTCFNLNTLILPKQKGEPDRVDMLKEEEMWDLFLPEGQDEQKIYPVGWIHTHPAFDCFLSSVDIHNQCGYQVMLDEAVAIVMSPRDSQNRKCGIFRLTTPGGMDLVKGCNQTGFHTHQGTSTGQKIYELCGHVFVNPRIKHDVIDLRIK